MNSSTENGLYTAQVQHRKRTELSRRGERERSAVLYTQSTKQTDVELWIKENIAQCTHG